MSVPQPRLVTERDFYNSVWAVEPGVHVSIHRTLESEGLVKIVIDDNGILHEATLEGYRWRRLLEWLDAERPVNDKQQV